MKLRAPQALRDIPETCPGPDPEIHFYGNPVYLGLSGKGQWQRIHSRDKFRPTNRDRFSTEPGEQRNPCLECEL
jgi:hypothetical protein